ncbi:FkbM family methyltransferase [Phenylobacterium soli]|uniref:Methyltransferase FkbM domain-containing protein n=1 Tax=Phenylobacterium soli TaxID=2170551 RepID=A0A328AF75_9CAUL|nr:FkbM family methyltransferase [Phenylobacterium soli]RAK53177.1 hypothetical protein DJ017_00845 [Phenylobacterium soli]
MSRETLGADDRFAAAIKALLARNPNPFFVQVGGYDGVSFDPLRPHVVASNLSGVIVEPVPGYFAKLQALYAGSDRVTPINCAISEEDGERVIWRFKPEAVESGMLPPHFGGISSFLMEDLLAETGVLGRSSPNAETTAILRTLVEPVPVQSRTMTSLLAELGVERVDILQVDTEGYDYRILQLFDFARFRPAVVHYEHQHLQPPDRAAAEQLLRSHGYSLSFDSYDTLAVLEESGAATQPLRALAGRMQAGGLHAEAITVLEHLVSLGPDPEALLALAQSLAASGRMLDALARLGELQQLGGPTAQAAAGFQAITAAAAEMFNERLRANDVATAELYVAALVALVPGQPELLGAALSCNLVLGREDAAARYAQDLLALNPGDLRAREVLAEVAGRRGEAAAAMSHRIVLAVSPDTPLEPQERLRRIHELAGEILGAPMTEHSLDQLHVLLAASRHLQAPAASPADWARIFQVSAPGMEPANQAEPPQAPPAKKARARTR